jgi:uncharacterized membrane protein
MKKLLIGLGVAGGLLVAKTTLAASTIFTWSATDTSSLSAWISQTWTDFSVPILIVVGIALGFVVIRKLVGVIKGAAR